MELERIQQIEAATRVNREEIPRLGVGLRNRWLIE